MKILENVYAADTTGAQPSVGTSALSPIPGVTNINSLVTLITNVIMVVGVAVFLVMLALGFIKYVTSQGDKAAVESAQKTLTYAVIGGVGLILVFVFRQILFNIIGADTGQLQIGE